MKSNALHLLSYASGMAGLTGNTKDGPDKMKQSPYLDKLLETQRIYWDELELISFAKNSDAIAIAKLCEVLAKKISQLVQAQQKFCVLGGDHTAAIGTWSGVYDAMHQQGELGLIWVDAHMDSHTPQTTETGNIHGMPLACLLGKGYQELISILHNHPKLQPQNVCLVGVRSFESGEAEFLKNSNVRIYQMSEIENRGLKVVWEEAVERISRQTAYFGISLDLDVFDPEEVPGVDVPEPKGIHVKDFLDVWKQTVKDQKFIGTEIVEFNPLRDKHEMTEKLIANFLTELAT